MSAIYVAAPYELKEQASVVAARLRALGHSVTSGWHDREDVNEEATARRDLEEVEACDTLLLINVQEWAHKGTGGRHVEYGYALARGKSLVIFGERTNLFHLFEAVRVLGALEEL